MSDHTINQTHLSSKVNQRIDKLGRTVEHLQVVAYHYKQAALAYRQLGLQIVELVEAIDQIDVTAFEILEDFTLLKAVLREYLKTPHPARRSSLSHKGKGFSYLRMTSPLVGEVMNEHSE